MKPGYSNLNRPGVRTTTTMNPKTIMEDIDKKIRTLSPEATPIQSITRWLGKGPKPRSHKIQVVQYSEFDPYDYIDDVVLGAAYEPQAYKRMALIRLTQYSRPEVNSVMYYQPQDKIFIHSTGQTVKVIMTPTDSDKMNGVSKITLRKDFAEGLGSTDATAVGVCKDGYVVVENIEQAELLPFNSSDCVYMGRTIYESQRIEAVPTMRDFVYDYNYVEHKEKVLHFTEDQLKLVESNLGIDDFNFNQKEMIKEFKGEVEKTIMFGERAQEDRVPGRRMHHMRGLIPAIESNVAMYNPDSVVDFEKLFANFMMEQAFRYNPNGNSKVCLVGRRAMMNFSMAFKDYRRTTDISVMRNKVGIDIQGYEINGFKLNFIPTDLLRQGTAMENWFIVMDPAAAELRTHKDYNSRYYQAPDERDTKLMIEWQGTVAWHTEATHAILRTA